MSSVTEKLEDDADKPQQELHKGIPITRRTHPQPTVKTLADAAQKLNEAHDPKNHSNLVVPGRTILKGHQWNGLEIPERGKAAARRLRQIQKGQVKP